SQRSFGGGVDLVSFRSHIYEQRIEYRGGERGGSKRAVNARKTPVVHAGVDAGHRGGKRPRSENCRSVCGWRRGLAGDETRGENPYIDLGRSGGYRSGRSGGHLGG